MFLKKIIDFLKKDIRQPYDDTWDVYGNDLKWLFVGAVVGTSTGFFIGLPTLLITGQMSKNNLFAFLLAFLIIGFIGGLMYSIIRSRKAEKNYVANPNTPYAKRNKKADYVIIAFFITLLLHHFIFPRYSLITGFFNCDVVIGQEWTEDCSVSLLHAAILGPLFATLYFFISTRKDKTGK